MRLANSFMNALNLSETADDGSRAIAEALKMNCSLDAVNLYGNRIGEGGSRAIAKALNFNSSLQKIDLRNNIIKSESIEMCNQALQALQGCRIRRDQNYCIWMCAFIDNWESSEAFRL